MYHKEKYKPLLVFLLSFILSFLFIGGASFAVYAFASEKYGKKNEAPKETDISAHESNKENSGRNIMFIFENDNNISFFAVCFNIPECSADIVIYPSDTDCSDGGSSIKLKELYKKYGRERLISECEAISDMEIDNYMSVGSEAFCRIINILGGASYKPSLKADGIDNKYQYLSGKEAEKIIMHSGYDSEEQRCAETGKILSAVLKQADGKRIVQNQENNFNSVINISDTDINAIDYENGKENIRYFFTSEKGIKASYRLP